MKISKTNVVLIWKQLEDVLVPRLGLTVVERAVYSHLLRHSRLEDQLRLRFSIYWLARGARLSTGAVRPAVRRLVAKGVLRLVERTKAGHVVEVRLPEEIRGIRPNGIEPGGPARLSGGSNLEEMDFLKTRHCARPSMRANGACASIVCAGSPLECAASIMSCRLSGEAAIRTATWFPPAQNATHRKEKPQQRAFCARSTATGV
jgi:hypothetical protein